ncbi:MAG: (d)CMP kinase [Candidatus Omnitrophica bacterium]|nr:(d)CMP kinase [Candidatus Omnitrophota bacterium]
MIIAIDGPAGSGKTTIAKLLSKRLNISYLDTGATYRALTFKALALGINLNDAAALGRLACSLDLKIDKEKIFLDGNDISSQIRTPLIDKSISEVVAHEPVRKAMVNLQRKLAAGKDVVVEGRDITTVVFPAADFKFYLDADFKVRAQRRFDELRKKGIAIELEEMSNDLQKRDNHDKNRQIGPLRLSADANYIDTTNLNIEGAVDALLTYIQG